MPVNAKNITTDGLPVFKNGAQQPDSTVEGLPILKKKDGGQSPSNSISTSTSALSSSQSSLAPKPETPTEFIINDIDKHENDIWNQLDRSTSQFFEPTSPVETSAREVAKRQTKEAVLSNPTALASYNKERLTQLDKKRKQLQKEQFDYTTDTKPGIGTFASFSVENPQAYQKNVKDQLEIDAYSNKLKNNVADIASDFIVSQTNPSNYNPREVGRKIIAIADPELDEKYKIVEKTGELLPSIHQAELERMGLLRTENTLMKLPQTPERDSFLSLVKDYKNEFDERNPQLTWQRAKEKIAAQLYREGKSAWFGFGYDEKILKEAVENPATDLTPNEKKSAYQYGLPLENRIIGTDVPTSGFARSWFNAIEKSAIGTYKSVADKIGIRNESNQMFDYLNQEEAQARYRAPGDSPTAQAQLAYLKEKAIKEPLSENEQTAKKSLENYVGVRNGWSRFKDGVGDVTGQVTQMALLTKGLGATGKLLLASGAEGGLLGGATRSAIGSLLSNETVGLMLNGYLNSYDNYKQQALDLMPGEDQAAARNAYANTMATVEGASELIFRDTKVLNAFTKEVAPTIRNITQRLINGELTTQLAKEELQSGLKKYLVPFAKEFVKSEVEEGAEEGVVDVAQGIADSVFGGKDFDAAKVGTQALNTFLTTMMYSPLVSGLAAHGSYRQSQSQNAFMKSAILDMAANPTAYLKPVEDLQVDGSITPTEAAEKIKLINSANQYLSELPKTRSMAIKTPDGGVIEKQVPLDYPEVTSYLVHRLNEGILENRIEHTTDGVLETELNKQLKRSQEIRKGIFNGSIAVTPDINDVTDNQEKADELGIADSNIMPNDELIGTPFQKDPSLVEAPAKNYGLEDNEAIEATQFVKELIDEDVLNDNQSNVAKEDPIGFLKQVADQVNNITSTGQQNKTESPEQAVRDTYGDTIVDYAKELFPKGQEVIHDFEYSKEQMNSAYMAADESIGTDFEGNAEESVNNAIRALTGSTGGKGRSKYYDTGKMINGKEVVIRVSNHGGYSSSEYKSRHGNTGIEAFDKAIQAEPDRHVISIIVNERGVRNQDYKNREGVTEIHIDGIKDANSFNESIDFLMNELDNVGFDLKSKNNGSKNKVTASSEIGIGHEEIGASENVQENKEEISAETKEGDVNRDEPKRTENSKSSSDSENPVANFNRKRLADELKDLLNKFKDHISNAVNRGPILKPLNPKEKIVREGGNALHTLKRIGQQYPQYASIVNDLINISDRQSLAVGIHANNPNEQGTRAFYHSQTDKIYFEGNFEGMPDIVIHEIIHAMTARKLPERSREKYQGSKYRDSLNEFRDKNKNSLQSDLIGLYLDAIDKLGLSKQWFGPDGVANNESAIPRFSSEPSFYENYGLYNIHEFLAEAFTNKKFQDKLKNIKSGSTTLWDRFLDFVKKALGIKQSNMLDEVIEIGKKAIASERGNFYYDHLDEYYANIADTNKIINKFITGALKDGNSIEDIKGAILDNGFSAKEVDSFFNNYVKDENEKKNNEIEIPEEENIPEEFGKGIDEYEMTTSGEVNKFMSGETIEDVFGKGPEGEQNYDVQRLTDMLQDGKNMIGVAQQKWGLDIADYGKPLFEHIQGMSNDAVLTNKKAVLLATFLGEIKETMLREPERQSELAPLYNAVEEYYQRYMNLRGKELAAGRLLRLYRDKYIGDLFSDKILEEDQIKAKKAIQEAEQKRKIDDETAVEESVISAEEKEVQDKSDTKASESAKKKQSEKKKLSTDEASKRATEKLREINARVKGGKQGLTDEINNLIKKLNCK